MNSKKLIVIVLFVLTVLIGALTIYLAVVLTKKNVTPTPTPTPYVNFSPTPSDNEALITPAPTETITITPAATTTVSPTATPAPTGAPAACGAACDNAICAAGNTCLLVNGNRKCVADICLNKTQVPPVINTECNGDLCTSKYSIEISKTAKVSTVIVSISKINRPMQELPKSAWQPVFCEVSQNHRRRIWPERRRKILA